MAERTGRFSRRMRKHDQLLLLVNGKWRKVSKIVRDQKQRTWVYHLKPESKQKGE